MLAALVPYLGVRPRQLLVRAAIVVCAAATPAAAQPATVTLTTGLLVDQALLASAIQDLEFRSINPGSSKLVAAQDAQSCLDACRPGKWLFQNLSNRGADRRANLQFTALPDSLTGPGGAKLGVAYTSRACVYNRANGAELGCVNQGATSQGTTVVVPINKTPGAIGDTKPATARDLVMWVGGTAMARPGQRAGAYNGVITLFFFYN